MGLLKSLKQFVQDNSITREEAVALIEEKLAGVTTDPDSVGDNAAHDTVQAAYDAAMAEGRAAHIKITESYDRYKEDYPVVFAGDADRNWYPVTLSGEGPGVTKLGTPETETDILHLHGPPEGGQHAYHRPATIRDLSIHGGNPDDGKNTVGIKIGGLPFGVMERVMLLNDGHGAVWRSPFMPMADGVTQSHSFGWKVKNTQAWGTQDGFALRPGSGAHSTQFSGCVATSCKGAGLSVHRSANVTWTGGDIQLCHYFGVRADFAESLTIGDTYIEGNGRGTNYPIEIYAKGCHGLNVRGNYFHGINPRGTPGHDYQFVQRAVNVHESEDVTLNGNTVRRYPGGFISAMSESSADLQNNSYREKAPEEGYVTNDSTVTRFGQ